MRSIALHSFEYAREGVTPRAPILFWTMLSTLVFSLLLYGFFFQATVHNVVLRTLLEKEIDATVSSASVLEAEYSLLQNQLTTEYAQTLGFFEPKDRSYVSIKKLARALP